MATRGHAGPTGQGWGLKVQTDGVFGVDGGGDGVTPHSSAVGRSPFSPSFNRLSRRRGGAGSGRGLHDHVTIAELGMELVDARASYLALDGASSSRTDRKLAAPRVCFPDVPLPYTAPHPTAWPAADAGGTPSRRHRSGKHKRTTVGGTSAAPLFKAKRRRVGDGALAQGVTALRRHLAGTTAAVAATAVRLQSTATALLAWATSTLTRTAVTAADTPTSTAAGAATPTKGVSASSPFAAYAASVAPQRPRTRLATLPSGCPARDVAWHPHYLQAAVALHDDTIVFFGLRAPWEPLSSGDVGASTATSAPAASVATASRGDMLGANVPGMTVGGTAPAAGLSFGSMPRQGAADGAFAVPSGQAPDRSDPWPCLRHAFQRNIARIAWQPMSGTALAVACRDGLCVWRRKRRQHKPSGGGVPMAAAWWCTFHGWPRPATPLRPGDCDVGVGDLVWSPCGRYLASSCPRQGVVVVWDMALTVPTALADVTGGDVTVLKWSSCGSFLFAGTASSTLRVWDTVHWTCVCVDLPEGPVLDVAVAPRGDAAVVAVSGSPRLYCVTVRRPNVDQELAMRLLPATMPCSDDLLMALASVSTVKDGGVAAFRAAGLAFSVREVAWDRTGERLAVTMSPPTRSSTEPSIRSVVKHGERAVVLFAVRQYPALEFDLRGLIFGPPVCGAPAVLRFAPAFSHGALLSAVYNVPIGESGKANGSTSAGIVRFVPLFFTPERQPLRSYPGIWLPQTVTHATPTSAHVLPHMLPNNAAITTPAQAVALLTGSLVNVSSRLRHTSPPTQLAQRHAVAQHHATAKLLPFANAEVGDRILEACGLSISSYGTPNRHTLRPRPSLDPVLRRVCVFTLPVVDATMMQRIVTDVACKVEWPRLVDDEATDFATPHARAAVTKVAITLQDGGRHVVHLPLEALRFQPLSPSVLLTPALTAAAAAAARRQASDGSSVASGSTAASSIAGASGVGTSVSGGRRRRGGLRRGSAMLPSELRRSPPATGGSGAHMRRSRSVGFEDDVDSSGGRDTVSSDVDDEGATVLDVGAAFGLLSLQERRKARKKVVASVCRVFATGGWPVPTELTDIEPSATDYTVIVSVQPLRLDMRGTEFEDFVRFEGDGIGGEGAHEEGRRRRRRRGSLSDVDVDGEHKGRVAEEEPDDEDVAGVVADDEALASHLQQGGGDGSAAAAQGQSSSSSTAAALFPHYYPHGRPAAAALASMPDRYLGCVDPDSGKAVYLDTQALAVSLREDIKLWLTAFDCMVRQENDANTDRPRRKGLLKVPPIGCSPGDSKRSTRGACVLGRRKLDWSTTIAEIMLEQFEYVLRTVHFELLAAIEFVDDSRDGAFSPTDWDDSWFGPDAPVHIISSSRATGGMPFAAPPSTASDAPACRDLLDFSDAERAKYVCGILLPVDGFTLPGNAVDFRTAEGAAGNCTDLRVVQSYVHNYHVLDTRRYTAVDA